jgi:hypothetical protein
MRRIASVAGTVGGIGLFLLTHAISISNFLGIFQLPTELKEAMIVLASIPTLIAYGVLAIGLFCLVYLIRDSGHHKLVLVALRNRVVWVEPYLVPIGLSVIVLGVVIAGTGFWLQSSAPPNKPVSQEPSQPPQPSINPNVPFFGGGPTTEPPDQRRYTPRTVRELLALYEGKTAFQADKLMDPYKGMWIETEGKIGGIYADGNGGAVAALRNNDDPIECRFSSDWAKELGRYNNGETLKVRGKLSTSQNGQQIYLIYCEVVEDAANQADDNRPIDLYTGKKIATAAPGTAPQTKNYFGPEKIELGTLLSQISDQLNGDALTAAKQGYRYGNTIPASKAELETLMHQVEETGLHPVPQTPS